jgi:phosphoenolpyruvate---glycerone phosphotransferase subunit DhaL
MRFSIDEFRDVMRIINDKMQEDKDYLVDLDSVMGDGDLGLSMSKGFAVASRTMDDYTEKDIGKALFQAGIAMNNAASSTMGTLMATALMRAGKAVKGREEVDFADIVEMGFAVVEGIKERGKASLGDKTILDALVPAVEELKKGSEASSSVSSAFEAAYQAAKNGLEATKDMIAQHGRGRYYGEKSRGKQDPGATVAVLITEAISNYLSDLL